MESQIQIDSILNFLGEINSIEDKNQKGILSLQTEILAKIFSYLPQKKVLGLYPLINRHFNTMIKQNQSFIQALNSEFNDQNQKYQQMIAKAYETKDFQQIKQINKRIQMIDNFIIDQKLLESLLERKNEIIDGLQGQNLYKVLRILKINYDISQGMDLELIPLQSSSKDYNQSIHRTINKEDPDQFWSSKGSESPDDNEWLEYKIPINSLDQNQIQSASHTQLKGCAIIRKFSLKIFDPSIFQNVEFKYSPNAIQIEIGMHPNAYNYKSKLFFVDQESTEEQHFDLSPDICCGRFIKINLLGKPHRQPMDNKYFVAVNYVGVQGIQLDKIEFGNSKKNYLNKLNSFEEKKQSEMDSSKIEDFEEIFYNLVINSNKFQNEKTEKSSVIQSSKQIESIINENYQIDLQNKLQNLQLDLKTSDLDEIKQKKKERIQFIFENREQVAIQYEELYNQKVFNQDDILNLFQYSLDEMGISSKIVNSIIFKHIDNIHEQKDLLNEFIQKLCILGTKHRSQFIDRLSNQQIQNITQKNGKYSQILNLQQRMYLLLIFNEYHQVYRFNLMNDDDNQYADRKRGFMRLMQTLNQFYHSIKKYQIEFLINAFFDKYGKTSQNFEFFEQNLGFFNVDDQIFKDDLDRIRKEIKDAKDAQMSQMYA